MNSVFVILISLIIGILTGRTGIDPIWSLLPAGGGLGTCLSLSYLSRNPLKKMRFSHFHFVWIALLFISVGMFSESVDRPSVIKIDDTVPVTMEGRVGDITSTTLGDRFLLDVSRILPESIPGKTDSLSPVGPMDVKFKALVTSDATQLKPGDVIELRSTLSSLTKNESMGNKRRGNSDILYSSYVNSNDIYSKGHISSLSSTASSVRRKLEINIEKSGLADPTKNFIITLLLGDREFLNPQLVDSFSDTGVAHILAVSGMHVGIVLTIVLLILYPLSVIGKYKWRYILAIPVVWCFACFTGLSSSAVRASIMITFYLMTLVLERKHSPLKALCWAAVIILIVSPGSLFDVGFQLSFLCVGSLIVYVKPLNFVNHRHHPILYKINGFILVTLIASLSSWVVSSYYFQRVSLMFLPANIIAVPLLPIFVGIVLVYFILTFCGIPADFVGKVIDRFYELFCSLINFISGHSATLDVSVGDTTLILWIAGLITGAWLVYNKRRRWIIILCAVLFLTAIVTIPLFERKKAPNYFEIKKSLPDISVFASIEGKDTTFSFQKGYISAAEIKGVRIVAIERGYPLLGLTEKEEKDLRTAEYVILGSGFSGDFMPYDKYLSPSTIIILHTSLSRKRQEKLLSDQLLKARTPIILSNSSRFERLIP